MQIAIFGTFDIGNFGDLMFPIIAEHKLSALGDVDITRFSYRDRRADNWFYDVSPIQDFPAHANSLSLVIIGGGHLVHFHRLMAHGYGPTDSRVPHPLGFWWVPAIAARMAGFPVALNAVSVDPWVPRWAEPLVKSFVDSLNYVAVRDAQSQSHLRRYAGKDTEIKLVPDTVHCVSDLIKRGMHSDRFKKFRSSLALKPDYIVVQPSWALRRYSDAVGSIVSDAVSQGLDVLELPIFHEKVDSAGFFQPSQNLKRASEWPEPILLAEIIANAQSVIGVSLHLSIVASAYGVPVHRPTYSPESKFAALEGLPNMVWLDSSPELSLIDPGRVDLSEAERRKQEVNNHWRSIYELADPDLMPRHLRAWDQILLTPEAFRRSSGIRDKLDAMRLEASRRGHLAAYAFRNRS